MSMSNICEFSISSSNGTCSESPPTPSPILASTPNPNTPTLAFNGGTFTRPRNHKERKGLYFISTEKDASAAPAQQEGAGGADVRELLGERKKAEVAEAQSPSILISKMKEEMDTSFLSVSTNSEENFECLGEGSESFSYQEPEGGREVGGSGEVGEEQKRGSLTRNGWQRTSLRRTPNGGGPSGGEMRRWGSFRNSPGKRALPSSSSLLASQLYRSSSHHSSGRSSAGDPEELYSEEESSLEGEVQDLSKRFHTLEEKFSLLAESQGEVDARWGRVRQENTELKTKLFMLEEQMREAEARGEERVKEEARRGKETLARLGRERELEREKWEGRLSLLETELGSKRLEVQRLEGALERERGEALLMSERAERTERELEGLREEEKRRERQDSQALLELKRQLETLSQFHLSQSQVLTMTPPPLKRAESGGEELREAEEEVRRLRKRVSELEEANEELSAQLLTQGLEDGRNLLRCTGSSLFPPRVGGGGREGEGHSLAAEFELEAMSNDEMRSALKDQKEANVALRAYIDNILLSIVEHYPQLLEVKIKKEENGQTL